jgi:tetratricopeptide (TPR) repeat protein
MDSMASGEHEPGKKQARPLSRGRRWLFRLAAVLLGLSPLVAFEGLCVVFDWGRPELHEDPFVGFRSVVPLFVESDDHEHYEIPKSRLRYFCYDSFPIKKSPDEYRIFCLGGSTVQGRPFGIETAFSSWLEISLEAAYPSRETVVVNCGGISYASYRLVPILEEVLGYQPDLIILYTGQNEFLEAREFAHVERRGRLVNAALEAASRLRTFALVRDGILRLQGPSSSDPSRPILPTEVEALLDYKGGLDEYHRDDAWREGVIAQYGYNLRRMIEMTRAAGVEMILCNPVSNWCDSPPFKSQHQGDLTPEELNEWEAANEAASRKLRGKDRNLAEAIRLYERACRIDPLYAGGFYNLAQCYHTAGRVDQARAAYLKAKDLDICPLRVVQPMNDAVLAIAKETGTPLLDAQELFQARSKDHITGGDWLVDHVHPGIEGHQLLAAALTEMLIAQFAIPPAPGWEEVRKKWYREHFDSIQPVYFSHGMEHLSALRNWAAGRAVRLRGEPDEELEERPEETPSTEPEVSE